ncbi:hypothetical protein DICVIV_03346 [Dictyocaulus viviparus]|uniref:NADAR domain-containing protein n=1 Tax=Dictyocaulus viviparus TaxID=29172 RepID=A0A0D8Y7C5_DICVI|nr:hypothetical protein DICVIV_03346 [Dictyocaulus viviparus]
MFNEKHVTKRIVHLISGYPLASIIYMFNRSISDKSRVTSSTSSRATVKNEYLKRSASDTKAIFTSGMPLILEDDVIIVDDSKQNNSSRSVEITKDDFVFTKERDSSKRNRLFDPLPIKSPQSSHINRIKQLRLTIPCTDKELATFDDLFENKRPRRKPITFSSFDDQITPCTSNSNASSSRFHIESQKSAEDFNGSSSSSTKNSAAVKEEAETEQSFPHVHKSETLTIIIPKRRVTLRKPVAATHQSDLMVNKNANIIVPESHANFEVERLPEAKESTKKCGEMQNHLMASKDDLQPISDDDSDDKSDCRKFSDFSVFKAVDSDKTIISFSSGNSLFSNHFPCQRLLIHGQKFFSVEQYYVWTKAKFCKDFKAANAVFNLQNPNAIREIGNRLKNIDLNRWMAYSWKVRMKATMAKYKQNRRLRYQLFRTIGSIIVEADKDDTYWGVGLSVEDPDIADLSKWRGYNVMGEVLMQIRDVLQENSEYADEVYQAKKNLFRS